MVWNWAKQSDRLDWFLQLNLRLLAHCVNSQPMVVDGSMAREVSRSFRTCFTSCPDIVTIYPKRSLQSFTNALANSRPTVTVATNLTNVTQRHPCSHRMLHKWTAVSAVHARSVPGMRELPRPIFLNCYVKAFIDCFELSACHEQRAALVRAFTLKQVQFASYSQLL
jgi:hypothetical protein